MAQRIQLTQGKYALVDDRDYYWASKWKWYAREDDRTPGVWYARRTTPPDSYGKRKTVYLHKAILERYGIIRPPGTAARHRNGDGLDNRLGNLWYTNPRDRYNH